MAILIKSLQGFAIMPLDSKERQRGHDNMHKNRGIFIGQGRLLHESSD